MSPDIKGPGTFNGSRIRGHHNAKARLTPSKVTRIWVMLHRGGMGPSEIARKMGVSPSTVSNIKAGRVWSHLTSTITIPLNFGPRSFVDTGGEKHNLARLTDKKARQIFREAHSGKMVKDVAASFGVSQSAVSNIKHRRRYASATAGMVPGGPK